MQKTKIVTLKYSFPRSGGFVFQISESDCTFISCR